MSRARVKWKLRILDSYQQGSGVEGSRIGWGSKDEKDGQLASRMWMDVGDLHFGRIMVCKKISCPELQHASFLTGHFGSWEVMNSTGTMPVETQVSLRKREKSLTLG